MPINKNFDVSISELLEELENIIEIELNPVERFFPRSKHSGTTRIVIDKSTSLKNAFLLKLKDITELDLYRIALKEYEVDKVFSEVPRKAGYKGNFIIILMYLIGICGKIKRNKAIFDKLIAINELNRLRLIFQKPTIHYYAQARILGIEWGKKKYQLPNGVEIIRLNQKESSKLAVPEFIISYYDQLRFRYHPIEARMQFSINIDHTIDDIYNHALNNCAAEAKTAFDHVISSFLIATSSNPELGEIKIGSEIPFISQSTFHPFDIRGLVSNAKLKFSRDSQLLSPVFNYFVNCIDSDKVLQRALHRFMLGKKREDVLDKIVDYVIAWESILSTINNGSIDRELSYRFMINGASLMSKIRRNKNPYNFISMFKGAYDARSTIVHGGNKNAINKILVRNNITTIQTLCKTLENEFRAAFLWLIKLPPEDRPYSKVLGWEKLIWY